MFVENVHVAWFPQFVIWGERKDELLFWSRSKFHLSPLNIIATMQYL